MDDTSKNIDRRMFERVSLTVKLTYEIKSRPKIIKKSVSKDLSGGGICLSLSEKFVPSTELIIKIKIGDEKDTICLGGKVVWARRMEIVGEEKPLVYYDTGIEFRDGDPININRVITYFYGKSF